MADVQSSQVIDNAACSTESCSAWFQAFFDRKHPGGIDGDGLVLFEDDTGWGYRWRRASRQVDWEAPVLAKPG